MGCKRSLITCQSYINEVFFVAEMPERSQYRWLEVVPLQGVLLIGWRRRGDVHPGTMICIMRIHRCGRAACSKWPSKLRDDDDINKFVKLVFVCRRRDFFLLCRLSLRHKTQQSSEKSLLRSRSSQTFVSTLGEWRNNFYDLKLILKHIIWIHFMMHSFITTTHV